MCGAGCGQKNSGGAAAEEARSLQIKGGRTARGRLVTDYPLTGVVKRVEKELAHVTIDHEAIPEFMGAMKMRFPYRDLAVLEKLEPGDHVKGTLRVEEENGAVSDYELLDLIVTLRAPPRVVLDISKGRVKTREQVQRLEVGDPVPDCAITMQDGKLVKLSELRGNVVVLTFIYTRCPLPDFCPLMDRKFAGLAQRISSFPDRAKYVRMISLSFDPDHDTPDVLRKHAEMRGATPPLWSYAVASHDELAKIGAPLGLFYGPATDEIAHNLCTAVIDPQGKLARLEVGTERNKWEAVDLLKTIYSLLTRSRP
jgi:protein SCO1/2